MKRHLIVSKKIIAWLLAYNLATWLVFTIAYNALDFPKHFDVPDAFDDTWDAVAYYAFQVQTQMYGTNIVPKTRTGRTIVALHGVLAWSQMVVFLAPWIAVSR